MLSLSSTCLAIALADKAGRLTVTEHASRLGGTYIAIGDDHGIIEVALDQAEADARIAAIRERMA